MFLFTGETRHQYGYQDGPQADGTFWYTGEGQVGDMDMLRGNRNIRDAADNGREIHLFEYVRRAWVRYVGRMSYVGHHWSEAPDRNANMRNIVIFELAQDNLCEDALPESELGTDAPDETGLWKMPLSEVRANALRASPQQADARQKKQSVWIRSESTKV